MQRILLRKGSKTFWKTIFHQTFTDEQVPFRGLGAKNTNTQKNAMNTNTQKNAMNTKP